MQRLLQWVKCLLDQHDRYMEIVLARAIWGGTVETKWEKCHHCRHIAWHGFVWPKERDEADDLGVSVGVLMGRRDIYHFLSSLLVVDDKYRGLICEDCTGCHEDMGCDTAAILEKIKHLCFKED